MESTLESSHHTVEIPSSWYFGFCLVVAGLIGLFTWNAPASPNVLGAEVLLLILALFIFGSIRNRIDKNALTYGALPIILVTFFPIWWPRAPLREEMSREG